MKKNEKKIHCFRNRDADYLFEKWILGFHMIDDIEIIEDAGVKTLFVIG